MIEAMDQKIVAITPPGAIVDDASYTTSSVDTKGWDRCDIVVLLGATDIAMAALKVQESNDDGNADAYADVPGLDFDGDTQPDGTAAALPTANQDNKLFHFGINLKGRKRYFDVVATAGNGTAGTYMTAFAILSRGKVSPNSMAERGFTGELLV